MGGPKSTARRLDGKGERKDGRSSSIVKPEQRGQGDRARRSGKPVNLKVDVESLESPSPRAFSTSPIEKHVVNAKTPKSARRNSSRSFLQPDQFIAELKVKTWVDNSSELSLDDSPGSARSTRSIRSCNEPRNEAVALEPPSPHFRKYPKPNLSNGKGIVRDGTQPVSQEMQVAAERETMSRRAESSDQQSATSRAETGLESFYEPANAVPMLELSYEGKPAPPPAHLRIRTGTGHSTNSTSQPSLDRNSEDVLRTPSIPELQKTFSQSFKGTSPARLKLQATSALLSSSFSPANMQERLVRSVSAKKDSSSREGDSRNAYSFHAGMATRPHTQPIHSQPIKASLEKSSNDVEGNVVKPAGRLRRMLHWFASKTGLEKSSKVNSSSKNDKMDGGKDDSKAEQQIDPKVEPKIEAEREIKEVSDPAEKIDPETFDDGNWSPDSASSVSTTYSDVSTKSHSYKHPQHKKTAKSEALKSKLWLLRVQQKLQGRPGKESEEDSIYDAVRGSTFHGTPDPVFNDVEKKTSPSSARFNSEKITISKLVAKHKPNSSWDAGKLSPTDHPFSPKQPRLPKSDTHILLAPPKKLIGDTRETEFQRRRGKLSTLNTQSWSTKPEAPEKSPSPRVVSVPVALGVDYRPNSQSTTPMSSRQGQIQQGIALPASPSSGTFLQTTALILTSSGKAESGRSPKSSVVSPVKSEVHTPISPGTLPTSSKSSFGSFKGFNSPLPLPVRVEKVAGSQSSPSSPIYPASQSPRRFASPMRGGMQSSPTSPRLHTQSPSWTGEQSPTGPGMFEASSTSLGVNVTSADGAEIQNSLIAGTDATARTSPESQGSNAEEIFVLANSSFGSSSSSNSSLVSANTVKDPVRGAAEQGIRVRSRSASIVGRGGVNGPKARSGSSMSDERESSDRQKTGSSNVLPLCRPPSVSFEQIVAGRGRSPPTDNTLMKFFFKCREIDHLNKFLALQKKRFLKTFNTDSEKCFHMILSESGQGVF